MTVTVLNKGKQSILVGTKYLLPREKRDGVLEHHFFKAKSGKNGDNLELVLPEDEVSNSAQQDDIILDDVVDADSNDDLVKTNTDKPTQKASRQRQKRSTKK